MTARREKNSLLRIALGDSVDWCGRRSDTPALLRVECPERLGRLIRVRPGMPAEVALFDGVKVANYCLGT
jgi:hypothetical protein